MKGPGSEKARERKGQGAKGLRSESSRERIGQGPIGQFAPGSELARERKGSVPRMQCTTLRKERNVCKKSSSSSSSSYSFIKNRQNAVVQTEMRGEEITYKI